MINVARNIGKNNVGCYGIGDGDEFMASELWSSIIEFVKLGCVRILANNTSKREKTHQRVKMASAIWILDRKAKLRGLFLANSFWTCRPFIMNDVIVTPFFCLLSFRFFTPTAQNRNNHHTRTTKSRKKETPHDDVILQTSAQTMRLFLFHSKLAPYCIIPTIPRPMEPYWFTNSHERKDTNLMSTVPSGTSRWRYVFNNLVVLLVLMTLIPTAHTLSLQQQRPPLPPHPSTQKLHVPILDGDWAGAKKALRKPDCCVVSVPGLEPHVRVLQEVLADIGPAELDLRTRIHVKKSAYSDCVQVRNSVAPLTSKTNDETNDAAAAAADEHHDDPCSAALEELARGMASLADGPLEGVVEDVFCRIVCASDYKALEPPYHTDKAPLRGYVTLRGVGTEFVTRPCSPMEYMTLRTLGEGGPTKSLRRANELEFIVMKGDHYETAETAPATTVLGSSLLAKVWKRATACVHRSPPGGGGRRVIVSFDLADGDDDREWYQAGKKREWRSGMTQRKSHLVA
jgi:hypothetical protein